jgi:REP element-mobilizing transposase RayT
MSTKYKYHDQDGIYFISTAVIYWIDVFTRRLYKDIIIDSLDFCCKEKGLILYGYVIMSNHIHLIIGRRSETKNTLSDILRDFKKFTAMNIVKAIKKNSRESRKDWILLMMGQAGKKNSNNTKFQFWQQDNHPVHLEGEMLDKRLEYVHRNPVEGGWVSEPKEYFYSSARNYAGLESAVKITSIYDGDII